jgi:hypothetical protein
MAQLSEADLIRMVDGTPADPYVMFFDEAELDRAASEAAGRRIYQKATYIKVMAPGVTDFTSYRAQPEDIAKYRIEYERYKQTSQGIRPPGVDIIPNLDITHLMELRDMGLDTIPALAATEMVPPHLEYARDFAIAINKVLKEKSNGTIQHGAQSPGRDDRGISPDVRDVHPAGGQDHPDVVGRRESASGDSGVSPSVPTGPGTGRPYNPSGNPIDNWVVTFH